MGARALVKATLAPLGTMHARPAGLTMLTYHRVGGGSGDELDLPLDAFVQQLDWLIEAGHDVVDLDTALDRLDGGDVRPTVALTFDDGFAEVHSSVLPLLAERSLPFTLYLAAGLVGGSMVWEGSAAASQGAPALTWDDLAALQASGLCTVANHTLDHAGPDEVDVGQLDRCSDLIETHLGHRPNHFAWTWGLPVPRLLPAVRSRFRSAATGEIGRNRPDGDRYALARVPVRSSDPLSFFRAKVSGSLAPEYAYAAAVRTAKVVRRVLRRG